MTTSAAGSAQAAPLAYSLDELRDVMRTHYDKIIDFITSVPFRLLMDEMAVLSPRERPVFVCDVLLDDQALKSRGVVVPEGILIQRSAFGDRRPTLFAVKHFLPDRFRDVWENVNITFDNAFADADVSRERGVCWRAPLSPAEQAQLLVSGEVP